MAILTFFENFWQFYNWENWDNFDNWKDSPGDLWYLRHWSQFWQLKTWIQTIIVIWHLIVTLDSIRNSCDVCLSLEPCCTLFIYPCYTLFLGFFAQDGRNIPFVWQKPKQQLCSLLSKIIKKEQGTFVILKRSPLCVQRWSTCCRCCSCYQV